MALAKKTENDQCENTKHCSHFWPKIVDVTVSSNNHIKDIPKEMNTVSVQIPVHDLVWWHYSESIRIRTNQNAHSQMNGQIKYITSM